MFKNIGSTIKTSAYLAWLPIIIKYRWEAYDAREWSGDEFPLFWYTFAGLIIAIVTSLLIYGFGQLIENSTYIANHYKNLERKELQ